VPKLELLGLDAPYARPSNRQFQIEVKSMELRLPVREAPDCSVVLPSAAPALPAGAELAPGVSAAAAGGCASPAATAAPPRPRPTRRTPSRRRQEPSDDQVQATAGAGRDLPFTGLWLALPFLAGACLLAGGALMRRALARP